MGATACHGHHDGRGNRVDRLTGREKPAPLDLSHHYSAVTKRRNASQIKEAYKFFQIPGILNTAGGECPVATTNYCTAISPQIPLARCTAGLTHHRRPAQCRFFPLRHSRSASGKAREMDPVAKLSWRVVRCGGQAVV